MDAQLDAVEGDCGGFDDFYLASFGKVAAYATALVGERAAGDELAQEAMVRVYARWGRLDQPVAYAYRIATNLAKDRRKSRVRELQAWLTTPRDVTPSSSDSETWDAVGRLPERLRVAVLLHYYADLPLHQVAIALKRPLGTVKRQLHEARALLHTTLGEDA